MVNWSRNQIERYGYINCQQGVQAIMLGQLLPSICELLSSLQHGFVSRRSCVTQLLSVLHELGAALDAAQETDVAYLDFSKAFGSVPHCRLLHNLPLFGITGSSHHWFSDYLMTRSQRVLVDRAFSPWSHVFSGVPQGSLLGPFLFLLYVNDLPDVVCTDTSIALFADDVKCSHPISGSVDHQGLQPDLNSLYDWSGLWGLSFDHKKCETMRIARKRISQAPSLATSPYVLGEKALSVVTAQKDLGVTVSNTLTWSARLSCHSQSKPDARLPASALRVHRAWPQETPVSYLRAIAHGLRQRDLGSPVLYFKPKDPRGCSEVCNAIHSPMAFKPRSTTWI